jgi:D-3-phosphoglycerate dehydrogenase / 2-oxoglutarate reductase
MEPKHRILICGAVHRNGIDLLTRKSGFQVDFIPDFRPEEVGETLGDYEGLIVRNDTIVTADVIRKAHNLKVIGRAGAGLGNVDVAEATRRGIVVMNTPGVNAVSMAEHTISMIAAAHRHIPQAVISMKQGLWEKKKFQGREMAGRTLGVIGLGRIGSMVAKRAQRGLKMNVLGYDPAVTARACAQMGVSLVSLDELLSSSDVVTVHAPLNATTSGLIGAAELSKMKKGVIIVNCARAGIIDENALVEALNTGVVGAAALDALEGSCAGEDSLIAHPNVIATPHLAASSHESEIGVAVAVIEQVADFLEKGIIRNAVNVPSIDEAVRSKISRYLDLARRLGNFLGQLSRTGISEMELEYRGDDITDLRPVANAALVGLLSAFEGSHVNFVNAGAIAEERGIQVSETTLKEATTHGPSLEARIKLQDGGSISVQGAFIRRIGYEPRIIGIGEFVTEAVPAGPMLIVTNKDMPGMIAGMSSTLAQSNINIAQMNLSRDHSGGSAMSIINLDSPADDGTLNKIRSISGIISVSQVILDP